ncbi:MAG: SDR family NAD(P)-dependent oxidoreductase, partial [Chitinivibrionales bacterium]|nr:SDR family NAD(P)-dependent oxidoreductase [Chitinivibrionales bacterium]
MTQRRRISPGHNPIHDNRPAARSPIVHDSSFVVLTGKGAYGMLLEGKRILITGGSSGIGRALAIAMAAKGASVAVCGRHADTLEQVGEQHPSIHGFAADVTIPKQISALKRQLDNAMGGIDVLVNNAGRMVQFDAREGIPEAIESEVMLNLMAPLRLTRLFLPQLMQRDSAAIINVTSGLALWPNRTSPVYA